jgi:hypothetical protein
VASWPVLRLLECPQQPPELFPSSALLISAKLNVTVRLQMVKHGLLVGAKNTIGPTLDQLLTTVARPCHSVAGKTAGGVVSETVELFSTIP